MQIVIDLLRRTIPRPLRDVLRRPRISLERLASKATFRLGHSETVSIMPDWSVRCHPLCVGEFNKIPSEPSQQSEMKCFISYCVPGMRFLDIGAHWGVFTLAALHYGGPTVSALCIEASRAAAKVLRSNLELNG